MGKGFACGSMGDCNFRHFYENLLDDGTALALYADLCRHGLACGCGVYSVEKSHRWGGLGMLLAGGIVYTIGAVIYALKKPNLAILKSFGFHEIFHVFVMLGSAFHIAFMFLYVL